MKVDVDCKERIKIALTFLLRNYKVLMGSMVLLFVLSWLIVIMYGVTDNLYNRDDLNVSGLVFNFITFVLLCSCTAELRREIGAFIILISIIM